jgi:predicted HTH transcriptional regulator
MTNREFLNTVIETATSEEVKDHAKAMLAQMDARNAKRASTPSKTAVANAPLKQSIIKLISEKNMTAPEVGVALEVSTQKASALLRQLCEDGVLTSEEIKVPKKGKMKSYSLVEGAQYLDHEIAQ